MNVVIQTYLLDKSSISSSVMKRLDLKMLDPDDNCVLMLTDSLLIAGAMIFSVIVVVVAVGRLNFQTIKSTGTAGTSNKGTRKTEILTLFDPI